MLPRAERTKVGHMTGKRENQGVRRRQDKAGNPREVTTRMVDRYRFPNKAAYRGARKEAIENPKIILKEFSKCFEKHPDTHCHIWVLKTAKGLPSLTSQNGQGVPRFGMGNLSPHKTANARRYIWKTTYKQDLPDNVKIRMQDGCNELCVNPAHMLPRPERNS